MGCFKHPRRARRHRGTAIVEFAMVMPLLFALLLGVIDYGLWFNDPISVRQGVGEAARKAPCSRPSPRSRTRSPTPRSPQAKNAPVTGTTEMHLAE